MLASRRPSALATIFIGTMLLMGGFFHFAAAATLTAALSSPNAVSYGDFGSSIAVSGNTVIVGAPDETAYCAYVGSQYCTYGAALTEAGNAYVYDLATPTAPPITLTSPNVQSGGDFGTSVAVSGSTVVVGAPGEAADGTPYLGNAYVYDLATPTAPPITLTGSEEYGGFGQAVAVSGNTVVVGAPYMTALTFMDAGNAYVFDAATGVLTGELTSPNAQSGGQFGAPVAVSGNTVVVGADMETVDGLTDAGNAYVFDAATLSAPATTLINLSVQESGFFGASVAVSGNTVLVGAPGQNLVLLPHLSVPQYGVALMYNLATGGPPTSLFPSASQFGAEVQAYQKFGASVAVSGNTVVVGAPGNPANSPCLSANAYVFDTTTGALTSMLVSPNYPPAVATELEPSVATDFGYVIAVSGNTVVAGAPGESALSNYAGDAYVFNAATSALTSTLTSPNAQAQGAFGTSVAVSGEWVAVGAPGETDSDTGTPLAGIVYVFGVFGASCNPPFTLTSPNPTANPYGGGFGSSVALSGNTLVVGAPAETAQGYAAGTPPGYGASGNVYVFDLATGGPPTTLISPNVQLAGYFGSSVAVSGNTLVVGAPDETAPGNVGVGNAYVYNLASLTSPPITLNPSYTEYGGNFGESVAVSGNTVVVGAPGEDAELINVGPVQDAGDVLVFNVASGGATQTQDLTSPHAIYGGDFGGSVALTGNTLVVGAPGEAANGYGSPGFANSGNAYLYENIATPFPSPTTLTSPNVQLAGYFGSSVAVSGNTVVVGAPGETAPGNGGVGNDYVFDLTTPAAAPVTLNHFSGPVAVSGTTLFLGAPGNSVGGAYNYNCVGGNYNCVGGIATYNYVDGIADAGHVYMIAGGAAPCTSASPLPTGASAADICTGTPSGGSITAQSVDTGIEVTITGTSATGSVAISTSDESGSSASGVDVNLGTGAAYYDVEVSGATDGTAMVCITPASGATTIQYLDGGVWVTAAGITTVGNTICGNIPVSVLDGTFIAIGTPITSTSTSTSTSTTTITSTSTSMSTSTTGVPEFPLVSSLVIAAIGILAFAVFRRARFPGLSTRSAG
jgi:hypothetical protein